MEIYLSFIDWPAAEAKLTEGTFESEFFDAVDDETWASEANFTDVFQVVTSLGQCLHSLLPHCADANREAIAGSLGRFIAAEPKGINDLPGSLDPETFWLALGPQNVGELALTAERIDFDELQRLYDSKCPAEVRAELGFSSLDFAEHLQSWCSVMRQASDLNRGLVATVG